MRFMIIVKATKDSEAGVMPGDFAPSEAVDRFKAIGVGGETAR